MSDKPVLYNADLSDGLQRFAISGLSKERADEALTEEIILGKDTGEYLLKTKEGVVISADTLNRRSSSMTNAITCAEQTNIGGDIYQLEFDYVTLPATLEYNVNMFTSDLVIEDLDTRRFLLYLDLDEYSVLSGNAVPVTSECYVNVKITITMSSGATSNVTRKLKLSDLNRTVIDISENISTVGTITGITLSEIKIEKNADLIMNMDEFNDRRLIVHNVFLTMNI